MLKNFRVSRYGLMYQYIMEMRFYFRTALWHQTKQAQISP